MLVHFASETTSTPQTSNLNQILRRQAQELRKAPLHRPDLNHGEDHALPSFAAEYYDDSLSNSCIQVTKKPRALPSNLLFQNTVKKQ